MEKIKLFKEILENFEGRPFTIGEKTSKGYEVFTKPKFSDEKSEFVGYLDLDNLKLPTAEDSQTINVFLQKLLALQGKVLKYDATDLDDARGNDSPFFFWQYDETYKNISKNTKIQVLRGCNYSEAIDEVNSCIPIDIKYKTVYDEDEIDEEETKKRKQEEIEKIVKRIEEIDPEKLTTIFVVEDQEFKDKILVSATLEKEYFKVFRDEYSFDTYIYYSCKQEAINVLEKIKEHFNPTNKYEQQKTINTSSKYPTPNPLL